MSLFKKKSVKAVETALEAAGISIKAVRRKSVTSKAERGALLDAEVYLIGEQPILAISAGDADCHPENLARALNLEGEARTCGEAETLAATGFKPGGVAPVPGALALTLPVVIDAGLKRHAVLYAPAGDPNWVFPLGMDDLKRLTEGIVSYNIAGEPDREGHQARSARPAAA